MAKLYYHKFPFSDGVLALLMTVKQFHLRVGVPTNPIVPEKLSNLFYVRFHFVAIGG